MSGNFISRNVFFTFNRVMDHKYLMLIGMLSTVFFLFKPTVLSADSVDRLYSKAAANYHQLYEDRLYREKADNWLKTIKQFQLIYQNYPKHRCASKSLFSMGKLYRSLFKWNSKSIYLDRSNITFRKLINQYPTSKLTDNAQFLLAENYELLAQDKNLAYLEYKKLLEQYPKSQLTQKAQLKIKQLQPPEKDLVIIQDTVIAKTPDDLTKIRYGGLEAEENDKREKSIMVSKVDYWSTTDWSRMVINTKYEVRYKYQVLVEDQTHQQKRMYVDIMNAYIPKNFKRKIAAKDGLITQARIAQFDKKTVRVVLDMASLQKIKVFHFKLPHQYKIVIDILGKTEVEGIKTTNKLIQEPGIEQREEEEYISLAKVLGLKVKTIIIDPGHGGKDPGASAFNIKEKDIVLKICQFLKNIIKTQHPEIKVLMTRSRDKYIKLEARTAFANKNRGDLFLSIHINASIRKTLHGLETYYLHFTSDNEALNLAAKENQTSLKSISDLQTILNDLMTNSKIKESRDLAEKVQSSIIQTTQSSQHQMRDLGVKKAPFIVLLGAQMPSILIEAGFLSHKKEKDFLKSSTYQKIIAQGIYGGIKQYID